MSQSDSDTIMSHPDSKNDQSDSDLGSMKSSSKTASHDNYISTPNSKIINSKNLKKESYLTSIVIHIL